MSELQVRVYFEDTDAGGVVYHANHLKYFERARSDWLRELGVDQRQLLKEGLAFVVGRLSIDYRRPAYFEQLLTVTTQVTLIRRVSMTFLQEIRDEQGELIARGEVVVAAISQKDKKAISIPNHIREVIASAT